MPTGEGLVKLYAEGVQDASYFLATAQAVNHCLSAAQQQGRLLPQSIKGNFILFFKSNFLTKLRIFSASQLYDSILYCKYFFDNSVPNKKKQTK